MLTLGAPAPREIGSSNGSRVPVLYAAAANTGKNAVCHTDDNGENWEQISGVHMGLGV